MSWNEKRVLEEQRFTFFLKQMVTFWKLLESVRKRIIWVSCALLITTSLALCGQYIFKLLFDHLGQKNTLSNPMFFVNTCLVTYSFVYVVRILIHRYLYNMQALYAMIDIENEFPVKAEDKLLKLSPAYHDRVNTGTKSAKFTKGISKLINLMSQFTWQFMPGMYYLIINTTIILWLDWRVGVIFLIPFPIAIFLNLHLQKASLAGWDLWDELHEKSNGKFFGALGGLRTVLSQVRENQECSEHKEIRDQMYTLDIKLCLQMQHYFLIVDILMYGFLIGAIWYGAHLYFAQKITLGTLVYLISTSSVTYELFFGMLDSYIRMLKDLVGVKRMNDLFEEEIEIYDNDYAYTLADYKSQISFKNVVFTYQGKEVPAVKNMSFCVQPGEMIALVGPSGGGKSTIVKLMNRMYSIDSGEILLDGHDIHNLKYKWYRKQFAVVSQKADLFNVSIADNVKYGNEQATQDDIIEAIEFASFHAVLQDSEKFPDGLETIVGEYGVTLSGGQAQRLSIARAYLSVKYGAKFVLLDEATSHLDGVTESEIQKEIEVLREKFGVTLFVIAHRLSTIMKADRIYVIKDGCIVESGTHNDLLLSRNSLYHSLARTQNLSVKKDTSVKSQMATT